MTVEDFLVGDSGDRSGRPWQLVDGVPMAMAPTSTTHGATQMELGRLLGNHFVATDRQCQVIGEAGIVPRVRSHTNVRVPDIVVTCGTPAAEPTVSAPILVVEILAPSNASETYANLWT